MGLSLDFVLPPSGEDFMTRLRDDPYYFIENRGLSADFSFHILPEDLDPLSEAFGRSMSLPPWGLRPYLVPLFDEPGYGVLLVDREWVDYIAVTPSSNAKEIVGIWCVTTGFSPQSHHEDAVRDLINLCIEAKKSEIAVLHTWCG